MKKYIKQIAILALFASIASCSTEDYSVDMLSAGGSVSGTASATPGSISRLDIAVPITFKITTKEGVTATKIEIYKNTALTSSAPIILGDKVSDATIATDGKTAIYSSSTLGSFDVFPVKQDDGTTTLDGTTGTFPLAVKATFSDGTSTIIPYVQTIAKGIVWKILDADGLPVTNATSAISSFKLNDPTPVKIRFAAVKKAATTLTSIVGQWSKNGGAYSALPGSITADTKLKTIDIAAIPYSTYGGLVAGDEITYKFIVTAGTQTDYISTKITIKNQEFGASHSGSLSQDLTMNKFNLASATTYANETTNGEIVFTANFGFAKEGATKIDFVKTTLDYDTTDLFEADAAYTAGTKVTTVTDLDIDSVILYKITRNVNLGTSDAPDFQDVTYYGLLKVTDLSLSSSSKIEGFKFTYKEGELKL